MDAWEKSKKVKVLSSQASKVQTNTQVSTKVNPQELLHANKQLVQTFTKEHQTFNTKKIAWY